MLWGEQPAELTRVTIHSGACRILWSPGQFVGFCLYPKEKRAAAEPGAYYMQRGLSLQGVMLPILGHCDPRGAAKPSWLYGSFLWQASSGRLGWLWVGGVTASGHQLVGGGHLNAALCGFCTFYWTWKPGEKTVFWMTLLQYVTISYLFVINSVQICCRWEYTMKPARCISFKHRAPPRHHINRTREPPSRNHASQRDSAPRFASSLLVLWPYLWLPQSWARARLGGTSSSAREELGRAILLLALLCPPGLSSCWPTLGSSGLRAVPSLLQPVALKGQLINGKFAVIWYTTFSNKVKSCDGRFISKWL